MGGGGGSSTSTTQNDVVVNTYTSTTIDTKPLGEILADSQQKIAASMISGNKDIEAAKILNAERDRQLEVAKLQKFDTYMEHAKNGLILSGVAAGLLYVYKKGK